EDTSSLSAGSGLRSRRAAAAILADGEDRLRGSGSRFDRRREDHPALQPAQTTAQRNCNRPADRRGVPVPEQQPRPVPPQEKAPLLAVQEFRTIGRRISLSPQQL